MIMPSPVSASSASGRRPVGGRRSPPARCRCTRLGQDRPPPWRCRPATRRAARAATSRGAAPAPRRVSGGGGTGWGGADELVEQRRQPALVAAAPPCPVDDQLVGRARDRDVQQPRLLGAGGVGGRRAVRNEARLAPDEVARCATRGPWRRGTSAARRRAYDCAERIGGVDPRSERRPVTDRMRRAGSRARRDRPRCSG